MGIFKKSKKCEGKTYNVGEFSVLVPNGWLENPFYVVGSTSQTPMTNVVSIYKGAPDQNSVYSYPGITITIKKSQSTPIQPNKSSYPEPSDIDPVTIGDVSWVGFKSDNKGYPFTEIVAEYGGYAFQIMIATDRAKGKISIKDADVTAIISSITPTE